jgi:rhodanese-related sulfurtransferase
MEYVIIDQRSNIDYKEEHYNNSINIEENTLHELLRDNELVKYNINKDTVIFFYCYGGACAKRSTTLLSKLGYRVFNLGGYEDIMSNKEYVDRLIEWNVYE